MLCAVPGGMTQRTVGMKRRILSAVAPINALFVAISCGGASEGDGAPTSTAGTAGAAGTIGATGGTASGQKGGTDGGGAQSGGTGGVATGGTASAPTGGTGGGGTQSGGTGGVATGGTAPANNGGTANYGCVNTGPGTCCNTDTCYSLSEIRALLGEQGGEGGSAGESNGGASEIAGGAGGVDNPCPSAMGHQLSVCSFITIDLGAAGAKCCYVVRSGSCCGRPFVVDGARVAGIAERADWRSERKGADDLDGESRAALARAWTDDALMEHASVASFARFSLELMAIGAPASLVEAAHRAALDEVAHARDCFALAGRFSGRELGPSTLDLSGLHFDRDLEDLAVAALREGCIGETLAAALATEQAALAGDETCGAVLARIARDEEEHSLLAWRFLRYAIDRGGAGMAERLRAELREIPKELAPPADLVSSAVWNHYGRLTAGQQAEVVARTWREIILPAVALLCEQPMSPLPQA